MRNYAVIITMLFISLSITAQNVNVVGTIIESKGSIFRITITPIDTLQSAINATEAQPKIQIPVPFIGEAIIEIKSDVNEEYSNTIIILPTGTNIGDIQLIKKAVNLNELTVTGKRLQIVRDGMDYTIRNIQGTHLGDAGNLMDMLKWTPGILVTKDEAISVIGKGSPDVYINDRKIIDKSELLSLESSEVSRIEIVRDPGAKYSSGTSSVVRIYLRRPLKDYIGAALTNTLSVYNKVHDNVALNLNGKAGIMSASASFRYSRNNGKAYDYSGSTITHSENNIFKSNSGGYFAHSGNSYNIFGGLNFEFTKKSLFTVQYSGNIRDSTNDSERTQNISDNGYDYNKFNTSNSDILRSMHSVSSSYMLTRNADSKLFLVADFATRKSGSDENILEKNLSTGKDYYTIINNKTNYNIYTFNGDYSFKIGKEDDEKIGAEMGHVNNQSEVSINNLPQITDRNNLWFAAFANFHRWWWKFNVSLGLRYEYDYTDTKILSGGNVVESLQKDYSNIFPIIRVSYMHEKGKIIALSYRRNIVRPSFSSLSPIINYEDSLNYNTGNPLLKPTFKDRLAITFNWIKDLTFTAEYIYSTNPIVDTQSHDDINPNILVGCPINIDNSHSWSLSADYSYSTNKINMSVYASLKGYYIKYPYLNEMKSYNKVSAFFLANFAYNFYKNFDLYAKGYYSTPGMDGNMEYGYSLRADIGVSAKFFNKKLYVSIDVCDLFRKSVTPWWEQRNLDTHYWRKNEYDTRGVDLKVRYTFNSVRDNFKRKSGNDDLLNRTN